MCVSTHRPGKQETGATRERTSVAEEHRTGKRETASLRNGQPKVKEKTICLQLAAIDLNLSTSNY